MSAQVVYVWRGPVRDDELVEVVESHGGRPAPGWWERIRPHSLGWVTARDTDGLLVGFVNVAWDACGFGRLAPRILRSFVSQDDTNERQLRGRPAAGRSVRAAGPARRAGQVRAAARTSRAKRRTCPLPPASCTST